MPPKKKMSSNEKLWVERYGSKGTHSKFFDDASNKIIDTYKLDTNKNTDGTFKTKLDLSKLKYRNTEHNDIYDHSKLTNYTKDHPDFGFDFSKANTEKDPLDNKKTITYDPSHPDYVSDFNSFVKREKRRNLEFVQNAIQKNEFYVGDDTISHILQTNADIKKNITNARKSHSSVNIALVTDPQRQKGKVTYDEPKTKLSKKDIKTGNVTQQKQTFFQNLIGNASQRMVAGQYVSTDAKGSSGLVSMIGRHMSLRKDIADEWAFILGTPTQNKNDEYLEDPDAKEIYVQENTEALGGEKISKTEYDDDRKEIANRIKSGFSSHNDPAVVNLASSTNIFDASNEIVATALDDESLKHMYGALTNKGDSVSKADIAHTFGSHSSLGVFNTISAESDLNRMNKKYRDKNLNARTMASQDPSIGITSFLTRFPFVPVNFDVQTQRTEWRHPSVKNLGSAYDDMAGQRVLARHWLKAHTHAFPATGTVAPVAPAPAPVPAPAPTPAPAPASVGSRNKIFINRLANTGTINNMSSGRKIRFR